MYKLFVQIFFLCFAFVIEAADNKIIFLISPPRSLSVAFLRMIDQRGDFTIFHEPGVAPFNFANNTMFANAAFRSDANHTFQEVHDLIINAAETNHVFVKEMGFAACEYLPKMVDLLSRPEVYFIFLVRNPHHSLISHYIKYPEVHDELSNILSYKELYNLYEIVRKTSPNLPVVIATEDLYSHPRETVQSFCETVKIPFKEESLHWNELGDAFSAHDQWKEGKNEEMVWHWHNVALRSTGFGMPMTSYAVDEKKQPTFEEIPNLEHREAYRRIYDENIPYYALLLEASVYNARVHEQK